MRRFELPLLKEDLKGRRRKLRMGAFRYKLHELPAGGAERPGAGKGETGCAIVASLCWFPEAKLGPLPKTLNNRATRRMPSDLADSLSLNPEAHRLQGVL